MRLDFRADNGLIQPVMEVTGWSQPLPSPSTPFSPSICVLVGSSSVPVTVLWCHVSGWEQKLSSGATPWISSLSVCPSVCLSSQASCVTALHPVSSAPVLRPAVLATLSCVFPSFCVTYHCPGAPALPPRMPACPPAHPLAPRVQR